MKACQEIHPGSRPTFGVLVSKIQKMSSIFAEEEETTFDMVSLLVDQSNLGTIF